MANVVNHLGDDPLRPASTLILVRGSDHAPEILLMKRSSLAHFMPDAYVFAGGAVDPDDTAAELYGLSNGMDDQRASALLELPAHGLSFFVAAVREAFEECGLLLACSSEGAEVSFADWTESELYLARTRIGTGECGLGDLCRTNGWRLALDRLHYFAHWTTPVGLKRRFDTRFFIARAPVHQRASLAGEEISGLIWRTPRDALRECAEGRLLIMLPTRAALSEIAAFGDIDALFEFAARPRKITQVKPL